MFKTLLISTQKIVPIICSSSLPIKNSRASVYSSKVDKPLFDWMSTITYRISTIDHIYRIHFHKSEKKVKRMNFNDEQVTSKHCCVTDFSDTARRIVFRSVNLTSSVLLMKFLENIDLINYRSCISSAITTVCTKVHR